jgi:hypothetical protein
MRHATTPNAVCTLLAAALLAASASQADADVITDWNVKAGELIVESKIGTPPAVRVMALVQTAVHGAVVEAAAQRVSVDAAVASAHRVALTKLLPAQQASVDAAVQAALAAIPDSPAKMAGIAAGDKAAQAVLAARADEMPNTPDTYRPHTSAGVYVPTAAPAATVWAQRRPWLLASTSQMRPPAPPALTSEAWARDFNEVKAFGGRSSTRRSAEQTEAGRFWDYSLPPIYYGVLRSVAQAPGRDVLRNARLYAAAAQAMDDGLMAVFDAKYTYNFWRPATAIRNADIDGNDATERDAGWAPMIDTPMHPEYPSAHSALAAAVGAVVKAEVGDAALPVLATSSPTAKGATRRWTRIDDFVQEVGDARIWEGVHYRLSTDAGARMGRQIGELAATRLLGAPH